MLKIKTKMDQTGEMVSSTGSSKMVASLSASSSLNLPSGTRTSNSNISVTNIKREEISTFEMNKSDLNQEKGGPLEKILCNSKSKDTLPNAKKFLSSGAIRVAVPKVEDSDESETELADIESANINRRTNVSNKDVPRPMSWEGELSEADDMMDTENAKEFPKGHIKSSEERLKQDFEPQTSNESGSNSFCTDMRKFQSEMVSLKYDPDMTGNGVNSPLLARSKTNAIPANPSPDSAIHSVYTHSSPSQSPLTSRHAPYTPSLSRNNSDASHSSCYSYSSEFSPTHSPIQGRHNIYGNFNGSLHHSVLYRPILDSVGSGPTTANIGGTSSSNNCNITSEAKSHETILENDAIPSPGISRQQLINSPCPICGDRISGFHYGIFSCESCKGFFKRTVQNRKNYVCVRGGPCPVTISTRKKCPACRFDKCLQKGMKLEAIREDRTRGGRSTYQCSYTLPNSLLNPLVSLDVTSSTTASIGARSGSNGFVIKTEQPDFVGTGSKNTQANAQQTHIPRLLQEIMDVEHLWQYNETELSKLNQITTSSDANIFSRNPLLASSSLSSNGDSSSSDIIASLCNVADHRLYKIVKWCKSLPLFKNISIDDQICLLINSWCELLLFSCCFRSMETPGEIKISLGKSINLSQAKSSGLQACIERMLNLTDHLRRLRVDRYEYVAMKVIVLLQSDTSELQEPVKVRESQEKALQALQAYTLAHYPEAPAKFGELLLRIPELQKTCQLGKEMLTIKSRDGEDFNLLMELLRGEH